MNHKPMTVQLLIEELQKLNPDARIAIANLAGSCNFAWGICIDNVNDFGEYDDGGTETVVIRNDE